jgi:hypothetical protein
LKSLELDNDRRQRVSSDAWLSFFNVIQDEKYLESIKLHYHHAITSDAVMGSFSAWITSTQTLLALKVTHCSNLSSVGWQSFANALALLDNLEDIEIHHYHIDATSGMLLLNAAFIAKPSLKTVSLDVSTFAQLERIVDVLGSPNCNITELNIMYGDRQDRSHILQ